MWMICFKVNWDTLYHTLPPLKAKRFHESWLHITCDPLKKHLVQVIYLRGWQGRVRTQCCCLHPPTRPAKALRYHIAMGACRVQKQPLIRDLEYLDGCHMLPYVAMQELHRITSSAWASSPISSRPQECPEVKVVALEAPVHSPVTRRTSDVGQVCPCFLTPSWTKWSALRSPTCFLSIKNSIAGDTTILTVQIFVVFSFRLSAVFRPTVTLKVQICPQIPQSCKPERDQSHQHEITISEELAGTSLLGSLLEISLEGILLPGRLPVPWLDGTSLLTRSASAEGRWLPVRDPVAVPGSASRDGIDMSRGASKKKRGRSHWKEGHPQQKKCPGISSLIHFW